MSKFIIFLKNLRPEYKVALFFVFLLMFYGAYSLAIKILDIDLMSFSSGSSSSGGTAGSGGSQPERKDVYDSKSSIGEAVSAKRPIIIDKSQMRSQLGQMAQSMPEVKGAELATETDNPVVWVYMQNDGSRRDDLASDYCKWLHSNGVIASRVTVLDESGRSKGKMIEMGDKKCM